jgi:hypothetical protein
MYSISILNPFHRRVLDPCADHRCNAEPRLLPLRAMSLSCIVSQYGTAGVPRIPGAVGQLLTFLLAFGPDGGGKNGLHPNARNLRRYCAACHRYLDAICFCARDGERAARHSGALARLSLRQSDQRDQRCKAVRAGRSVLDSSVRAQFLHDEVGT